MSDQIMLNQFEILQRMLMHEVWQVIAMHS